MNSIKARVEFSFKGETYTPEAVIDLDKVIAADQDLTRLHAKLAQMNGIDPYSYLYEVMESSEIHFSNATGSAAAYLNSEGQFDFEGFRAAYGQSGTPSMLQIARQHMQIDNLEQIEGLEAALLAAYQAGREGAE
ncbi:MAG: hypothetical protein OEZ16_12085 [Chromatiales bacterium]|nr:hypothetical protein [Chromatiales bacterium]